MFPKMQTRSYTLRDGFLGLGLSTVTKRERKTRKTDALGPEQGRKGVVGEKGGALGHLGSAG